MLLLQRLSKRVKFIREVVRDVAGLAPYERRVTELLKVGKDKRALKLCKRKVSILARFPEVRGPISAARLFATAWVLRKQVVCYSRVCLCHLPPTNCSSLWDMPSISEYQHTMTLSIIILVRRNACNVNCQQVDSYSRIAEGA